MPSVPLYKEVRDQLVESLVRQEWRPGEVLPSEKDLAARFAVAVSTIRSAVAELVDASILVRKQGKGTYVAHHGVRGGRYRFFNVVNASGVKEPFFRTLISIKVEKASSDALRLFEFPRGARQPEVYRIRFKLSGSGPAFSVAEVVLPSHLFRNLERESIVDGDESLYAVYQQRFGVNIVHVVEHVYAVKAPALVARSLSLPADEPVLEIRRTGYTYNNVAVEQRTTWIHTRDFHYFVTQGAPS
jgi:GntR family transcriptional regulator